MGSFCDFGWVRVCHTQAANHVKLSRNKLIVILGSIYQPHFEDENTAMRLVFMISNPQESNDDDNGRTSKLEENSLMKE